MLDKWSDPELCSQPILASPESCISLVTHVTISGSPASLALLGVQISLFVLLGDVGECSASSNTSLTSLKAFVCLFLGQGHYVARAGLMTLGCSCLNFPSAGIIDICHHDWFEVFILKTTLMKA